jgi:hypothetical protein
MLQITKAFGLGMAVCSVLLAATPTTAAEPDQASPKETLAALRVWNSEQLKQSPALMDLEVAVSGDCRSKAPASVNVVDYCSCARALVMRMWLSGVDPAMVKRVNDYAADPKSADASSFVRFQGPELYEPFCKLAIGAG